MSARRSRNGCDQCRQRRKRCDEQKPTCGSCLSSDRDCQYSVRLRWGGREFKKSCFGKYLDPQVNTAQRLYSDNGDFVYGLQSQQQSLIEACSLIPSNLPNGIAMPQKYSKLLDYFIKDILASISCHESVHQDLCKSIVPRMLECPHLLSAALTFSAIGWSSRGLTELDGTNMSLVKSHLQSSSLSLFRSALEQGQRDEQMLATCLMLCLADVYAGQEGDASLQYHLQGAEALLKASNLPDVRPSSLDSRPTPSYLYHLYLALRILSGTTNSTKQRNDVATNCSSQANRDEKLYFDADHRIDGFLGYSTEDLHILQEIEAVTQWGNCQNFHFEAETILRKVSSRIHRDSQKEPDVLAPSSIDAQSRRDFLLCHQAFQHASLIHIYRKLYQMPSSSEEIQTAVKAVISAVSKMTQGQHHNPWVVTAMPLFTIGCEALTEEDKSFVLNQVERLESCLGSAHIRVAKEALKTLWKTRIERGDSNGQLSASEILGSLGFSVVVF